MKILIIQEKGRHAKNWQFRESLNFQRAFEEIGIDCVVWGLNYDNYNISFNEISKDCDVLLLIENYNNGWLPNLKNFKGLKLFWSIDSHVVLKSHINTCNNNNIDIVLNSIESHGGFFKQKTHYLPNAYPDDLIFPKKDIIKSVDVGFCGNLVNRANWINSIPNIKKDIMQIGDDMVNSINSYKIHFNRNMSDDVNYRTFETLGCKTFLLTNETENLNKLFDINQHLVVYKDKNDLNEKIKYYLNNQTERINIETSGYNHVKKYHTYLNRVQTVLEIIKKNI